MLAISLWLMPCEHAVSWGATCLEEVNSIRTLGLYSSFDICTILDTLVPNIERISRGLDQTETTV